jgi:DNA polymerase/3'-5' exonuclease PolX
MPSIFYRDLLNQNDLVVVILEQIDYLLKLEGKTSPYGYAAYTISQLKSPLSEWNGALQTIKGPGRITERIINEIIRTGRSTYHETLLNGMK